MSITAAMPAAKERPRRTRTTRVSGRPALVVSQLLPINIDLLPGTESLVCPDCKRWCPITGHDGATPKLVPHHSGRAETGEARRCIGSNRRVELDLTIPEWHQLLADAIKETASRRPTTVLRKPKTPPAPPVSTMTPAPLTAEAARVTFRQHQERCAACAGTATSRNGEQLPCPDGERLAVTFLRLMRQEPRRAKVREFFARERARFDRQHAASACKTKEAQWAAAELAPRAQAAKRSGTVVEEANNTQTIRPDAVSELRGADVPLTPPADHRPAPVGPECARCGATESDLVRAVAAGWRLVRCGTHCAPCASGFPVWMTTQI